MKLPTTISGPFLGAIVTSLVTGFSSAALINIDSYVYTTSPGGNYPDSGNEMADGITASLAWGVPAIPIGLGDVTNLSGWLNSNPNITFNFVGVKTVKSVVVWAADSDGAAGVALPGSIIVRTPSNSFSQTFVIPNVPGNGSTVPLTLTGFSVDTDSLVIEAVRSAQWTMLSEVQFFTVPEPSSSMLLGFGLVGLLGRRKR